MLTCKVAQEPERVTQQFSVNGHWLVRFPTKTVQRRSYFFSLPTLCTVCWRPLHVTRSSQALRSRARLSLPGATCLKVIPSTNRSLLPH